MITNEQIELLEELVCKEGDDLNRDSIRAAIADLKALPVTADGVRVTPGMTVWHSCGAECKVSDHLKIRCFNHELVINAMPCECVAAEAARKAGMK